MVTYPHHYKKLLIIFISLSLLEGLLATLWIFLLPSEPKNAIIFGLSMPRLFLLAAVILGLLGLLIILVLFHRNTQVNTWISSRIEKQTLKKFIGLSGLVLAGLIILLPIQNWGRWEALFERLLPILTWICLLLLQWFGILLVSSTDSRKNIKDGFTTKILANWKLYLLVMAIFLALYFLSTFLYPNAVKEDYWNGNGVPILAWQLLVSVVIGVIFNLLERKFRVKSGRRTDIILFLLIFIGCGALWGFSKLTPSYLNPGPYAPNNVYYPNSDAAEFDLQAQSALIGLGFKSGLPLDRPFYPLLLAIIHLFTGQSYLNNVILQAFLYGIFPAIVYLVCAEVGSRSLGVSSALAISFWGLNAIRLNNVLDTATPKQMLTDFPLAVVLSFVLLFTVKWLKGGRRSFVYASITGAVIALAAYVRYSALAVLPIWLIIAVIKNHKSIKKGLLEAGLILACFLIFVAPWYSRNIASGQDITIPFSGKIIFVLKNRYQPQVITPKPQPLEDNKKRSKNALPTVAPTPTIVEATLTTENPDIVLTNTSSSALTPDTINWLIPHMVHNLMSSFLVLPTSPEIIDLKTNLAEEGNIWSRKWDGQLPVVRLAFLVFQFFLLTAGLIALFRRDKKFAWVILLMILGVLAANSLGRTSGGRYIVPVDWLVIPVYFVGVLSLIGKLDFPGDFVEKIQPGPQFNGKMLAVVMTIILICGALPWIFERITMAVIPYDKTKPSIEQLSSLPGLELSPQTAVEMEQFIDKKSSVFTKGNAYFPTEQDLYNLPIVPKSILNLNEYHMLNFFLVEPNKTRRVFFPYSANIDIQNQDKVFVIGCNVGDFILVRDLVVSNGKGTIYYPSDYKLNSCESISGK